MSISSASWPSMPASASATLTRYLAQLNKRLEPAVEAVVLYGSLVRGEYKENRSNINLLLILQECTLERLQFCGQLAKRWGKDGVVPPLLFTPKEFEQSSELFPLEYLEMEDAHVLLEGRDPFLTLHINDDTLRQHCRREVTGNFLRLRQRFIEGQGGPEAIQAVLPLSLTALLPCLRALYRLGNHSAGSTSLAVLESLPSTLEIDGQVFIEVLEMKQGLRTPGKHNLPQLFEQYLQSLEQVVDRVRDC